MLAVRYIRSATLLVSAALFLSCDDSPTETEEIRTPASLDIVGGNDQSTHNSTFTGPGGQIIAAPGIFPPGRFEYFWIMPDTPGTYSLNASAGGPPNGITATALP
jgi:hypothetical protein